MAKKKPGDNAAEDVNNAAPNEESEKTAENKEAADTQPPAEPEQKGKKEIKAAKALAEAEKKLAEAEAKLAQADKDAAADKDKYLRLAAEYDNYRKRSQKEREGLYADVKSDTVVKFLPVYDNLARALEHGSEDKAFLKGVEMTMTQLEGVFEKLGVTAIPAVGEKFDAARHEAVMHTEDEKAGESTVVQEFEKGFMLGEKVIRYSKVVVAN